MFPWVDQKGGQGSSQVRWLPLILQMSIYMLREMIPTGCVNIFLTKCIDEMNKRICCKSAVK